jgi:hypothetical protein
MAMAAILERSTLKGTISHGMIFLQGFIKFDQSISEECVGQTFDGRKKERKKERRRIIIIIRRRNGANTIGLPKLCLGDITSYAIVRTNGLSIQSPYLET